MAKTEVRRADRHATNLRFQDSLRKRKKIRKHRASINAAMAEAARMKRSKKAGCTDFDANMAKLGWQKWGDGPTPELKYAEIAPTDRKD